MKKTTHKSPLMLRTLLLTALLVCQPCAHAISRAQCESCTHPFALGQMLLVSSDAGAAKQSAAAGAESLYNDRCSTCHGSNGDGKGATAEYMTPSPTNFHDPKWQRSVSDAKIAKAIVYGGAALGLSESMPANPDLENQPAVVAALVRRIRKLAP